MKLGNKISWTYKHWLNSKQFTYVTKEGEFLKQLKNGFSKVHFIGNKNPSKVKTIELQILNN